MKIRHLFILALFVNLVIFLVVKGNPFALNPFSYGGWTLLSGLSLVSVIALMMVGVGLILQRHWNTKIEIKGFNNKFKKYYDRTKERINS